MSIPPRASTVTLPVVGKIYYFKNGAYWFAVWPNFRDVETSGVATGSTPGAAVANLVAGDCYGARGRGG